jgi:hypothetical protein
MGRIEMERVEEESLAIPRLTEALKIHAIPTPDMPSSPGANHYGVGKKQVLPIDFSSGPDFIN